VNKKVNKYFQDTVLESILSRIDGKFVLFNFDSQIRL
jgi:hypothetical protein